MAIFTCYSAVASSLSGCGVAMFTSTSAMPDVAQVEQ